MTSGPVQRPRPGPHNPVQTTPPRTPGSVRRTTTVDSTFPDGIGGRVILRVRGRDLRTAAVDTPAVLDELAVDLELEPWSGTIVAVDVAVASAALESLAGLPFRGLRHRLADLIPEDAARRTLCFSALEDASGAYLVSGYAGLRAGLIPSTPELAEIAVQRQGDVCIGWALDGPVIDTIRRTSEHAVPVGPLAPALEGDDSLAWHEIPPLSPQCVRRRRRTDVVTAADQDESLHVEHHFRDSYVGADGEEVMHEYVVRAVVDGAGHVVSIDVDARVLPWYECPGAVDSAQRLVGAALDDIAARVKTEFTGVTTCTHLNSTLRVLADASSLDRSPR
jgi:hypothetical protein